MTYRTNDIDGDFRRDPKTEHFCARCQKDLKPSQPFRTIHMVDGGPFALHGDDESVYATDERAQRGDMGWWPVGMDCAKKIGEEFTHSSDGWVVRVG